MQGVYNHIEFLSTPSARRATAIMQGVYNHIEFLSTPSARRATNFAFSSAGSALFLSTPSARRATLRLALTSLSSSISIHALREEGDH